MFLETSPPETVVSPPDDDDESDTSAATVAVSKRKSRRDPIQFEAALAETRRKNEGSGKRRKTSTAARNVSNVFGLEGSVTVICLLVLR
jgi:hypothetical protein